MGGLREEAGDGIGERECGMGSGRGDGSEMGSVTEEEGKRRGPVSMPTATGISFHFHKDGSNHNYMVPICH